MSTTVTTAQRTTMRSSGGAGRLGARAVGAALTLGVAYIHVKDQGGFPGDKAPSYVGNGYYALEVVAVIVALALLVVPIKNVRTLWWLAAAVALGPLVGFVLSRGPGLPNYADDKGNWTETLGIVSIVVEVVLLALAAFMQRSRAQT